MITSRNDPNHDDLPEPVRIRQLRWLVNTLLVTLIVGFIIIVVTLVLRLNTVGHSPTLPAKLVLPNGEESRAVTLGTGWVAVVTVDGAGQERVRVFDSESGQDMGVLPIGRE